MVAHDPVIAVEERPSDADADVVLKGLRALNVSVIGDPRETPIGVFIRDEERRVVGAARERECLGIYLDTFEYQALPFYQKLGFELYGTLEGYPPGYRQFYPRKLLRDVAAT